MDYSILFLELYEEVHLLKRIIFFTVILLITAAGCTSNPSSNDESEQSLSIYTSIYPLQYAAEQIAGNDATVTSIYPPGVDAHTYEPATKEITEIAEGDLFLYLGADMESFADSIKSALESQPIEFINMETTNPDMFNAGEESDEHGDLDPHVWLDPNRMITIGETIRDELITMSPDNEDVFKENFDSFRYDMQELDKTFHNTLDDKENKTLLVTHAAYGYWESAYGIEQIAISGISSSDEPSQKELTKIAEVAKENDLQYVIFEKNNSNKVASIIQEYIEADKLEIHNLEVLSDEDIANNEDYLTLMKHNLEVLDQATE